MNKYVAPVLSALVVMMLAAGYAAFFFLVLDDMDVEKVVMVVIASISGLVVVGVAWALVARIRELRGGQEDDLGKY